MKTYEMIKFGNGYYIVTRLNTRTLTNDFYSKKKDINARRKQLEAEGYVEENAGR